VVGVVVVFLGVSKEVSILDEEPKVERSWETLLGVFGELEFVWLDVVVVTVVLRVVVLGDVGIGDVVLGDVEIGEVVLGDVEIGEVVLGVVEIGEVVLGDVEIGEVVLGDIEIGEVVFVVIFSVGLPLKLERTIFFCR